MVVVIGETGVLGVALVGKLWLDTGLVPVGTTEELTEPDPLG